MGIPKFPDVPPLNSAQVQALTEITFMRHLAKRTLPQYDLLFVFGSSHPEIWATAARAYHQGIVKRIMITGGYKANAIRHAGWTYGTTPEAQVIRDKLVEWGVPLHLMDWEDQSTNSLENVLFGLRKINVNGLSSLLFVSKSFAVGRQYRTLKKYLPDEMVIEAYPSLTTINKLPVTAWGWSQVAAHRAVVYGEYLRIVAYGKRGHILPLAKEIPGL
ncbi:YdcF family protein [Laceyella putida]|uniref:YdcF family protein n=1 Tax=Laceyella putida TaxID=110101 RepID=A0ABW2RPB7_9BACL